MITAHSTMEPMTCTCMPPQHQHQNNLHSRAAQRAAQHHAAAPRARGAMHARGASDPHNSTPSTHVHMQQQHMYDHQILTAKGNNRNRAILCNSTKRANPADRPPLDPQDGETCKLAMRDAPRPPLPPAQRPITNACAAAGAAISRFASLTLHNT